MTDNLAPDLQPVNPSSDGSFGAHVWGFFAGILSALAFVQIFNGGWLGLLLAYCSLLPLYLVGLAGGRAAVITATLAGIVGVLLQTVDAGGGVMATMYALTMGVPAMVVCRVTLIPVPQNKDGFISGSAILFTYLTLGTLLLLALGGMLSLYGVNLAELSGEIAAKYGEALQALDPNTPQEKIDTLIAIMSSSFANLMVLSWMVVHILNFVIAQWLAGEIGAAKRTAPKLTELELPGYLTVAVIGTTVIDYLIKTNLGIIIGAVGGLLFIGFLLVGLAIMHCYIVSVANKNDWGRAMRRTVLALYYIVFLGLQLPLLLAVLLGLSDPWLKWRRKFQQTPTTH